MKARMKRHVFDDNCSTHRPRPETVGRERASALPRERHCFRSRMQAFPCGAAALCVCVCVCACVCVCVVPGRGRTSAGPTGSRTGLVEEADSAGAERFWAATAA